MAWRGFDTMTVMRQTRRLTERVRAVLRWSGSVLLLVGLPKCALCVAGYLGFGAALGLEAAELCGAPADGLFHWGNSAWPVLAGAGVALVWYWRHRCRV